jgi:hypothetical protein
MDLDSKTYTAFAGDELIASGELETVLVQTRRRLDRGDDPVVLVFEDQSGTQIDFDLRGTPEEVLERLGAHPLFASRPAQVRPRTGPGRPRLGVVSREVSLLPRHWQWLERQPQGASAALRRLVDGARRNEPDAGRARAAREAAGRFMTAMAGDRPGFEEALRALYAGDRKRLEGCVEGWPPDVRRHVGRLVEEAERLGGTVRD